MTFDVKVIKQHHDLPLCETLETRLHRRLSEQKNSIVTYFASLIYIQAEYMRSTTPSVILGDSQPSCSQVHNRVTFQKIFQNQAFSCRTFQP